MQPNVGNLCVKYLQQANTALHLLKRLPCLLRYCSPLSTFHICDTGEISLLSFANASTGHSSYGQTGFVTGLIMRGTNSWIYHVLDWHSSKQARVSFSSVGAEILGAAEAADRSLLLTECLSSIIRKRNLIPLVLTVDSYGLYSTITTLHEGKDYRLRPTVSRLRDSFEAKEISVLQWIPGPQNIADALTKVNPATFQILSDVLSTGKLPEDLLSSSQRSMGYKAQ